VATDSASEEATPVAEPDEIREGLVAELTAILGDGVVESHIEPGADLWVRVSPDRWQDAARAVKSMGLNYFSFLSVIDWMAAPDGRSETTELNEAAEEGESEGEGEDGGAAGILEHGHAGGSTRLQVFARVESPTRHVGMTLKADLADADPRIGTWSDIFPGADWHEREAWEMFGAHFDGHPGLRNLYLPSGFQGRPLRKDFPLLARQVKPWPGVVDIEEIPPELEAELEAQVMAAFESDQGEGS